MISTRVVQVSLQNKTQSCTADGEVTRPFSGGLFSTATAEVWWEMAVSNKVKLSNEASFHGVPIIALNLLQNQKPIVLKVT